MAKSAGVSVATVSRVLNGSAGVKDETRDMILQAIDSLDYRPNFIARNLRLQKTKMILVILNSISNDFYAKVVRGIEEEGRKNGYNIMLCAMHDDILLEEAYISLVVNKLADGIIFMNTTLSREQLDALGKEFSIIQCSEYIENIGVPYVSIDNYQAAYDAVSHLIDAGRRDIAHITVNNSGISTQLRLKGYRQALTDRGFAVDETRVAYGQYGYKSAYAAMEGLLSGGKRPRLDAVFAISDRMAVGAVKCILDSGLRVPEDIAVAGFDNSDISRIYNPTITTISQSQNQMGRLAMKILIQTMHGKRVEERNMIRHELIVRQSSRGKNEAAYRL